MPPIRKHEASSSASTSQSSQPNGTGAKNVWFYMTGATTPNRPKEEDLQQYFDAITSDSARNLVISVQRSLESDVLSACELEKDKWQTWHNRPGPIARTLRQHLDGRHAIICSDDVVDQSVPPQSSKPRRSLATKPQLPSTPSSTRTFSSDEVPEESDAPNTSYLKSNLQTSASKSQQPSKRPRAPKSVERLRAELDKLKSDYEQVKAERDHEARERRLLKEELRRLKEAERTRKEELVKVSNMLTSSIQALIKK
ncbi:Lipase [Rhizoctonia solani]|uniref:Lipase n=1 Tax=Rhizoctonia solani TaxID=456999 RepID=A0A8H8P916_9AGAM|nr:Lipase [Rhizoctonia solani]QRW26031.1 Lipase [Rhizoctonia solani]